MWEVQPVFLFAYERGRQREKLSELMSVCFHTAGRVYLRVICLCVCACV